MQSFEPGFIERQPITQNLLRTIRLIGEYKGKQQLFKEQSPQVLETLRQAAIIQSTESSNRIEGITAPLERIKELVAEKTTPRDRSEQEIAGVSVMYLPPSTPAMLTSPLHQGWCYSCTVTFISLLSVRVGAGSR
ncbi:hypothetical protein NIES4075_65330 [Tolypothrix sp. NIES-4075]|uniref:hypothetical protein n=1 Tax=Tolypothrix sp. NIES-4075 TaxID=2005459 RepID=UPI000B762CB8|nr:hypothetical protein [Tolypothrix sp. NIES-4075]GAX45512.1 hypothetical protein NIES4075_65330 [Tolypothrix sp. NIES-4075]